MAPTPHRPRNRSTPRTRSDQPADVPTYFDADSDSSLDGRRLKRERNIEHVRESIIDLLSEGIVPKIAAIARRSGVTTRSIYRYFGDADAAVTSAVASRREQALSAFRSEPEISRSAPLDERLAMLVLRRLRLDEIVDPISNRLDLDDFVSELDVEVRGAFEPEIEQSNEAELATTLCGLFRLPAVRAMRDAFDGDEGAAVGLSMAVTAMLVRDRLDA